MLPNYTVRGFAIGMRVLDPNPQDKYIVPGYSSSDGGVLLNIEA